MKLRAHNKPHISRSYGKWRCVVIADKCYFCGCGASPVRAYAAMLEQYLDVRK